MDFETFKNKAQSLSSQAGKKIQAWIKKWIEKIEESWIVISDIAVLEKVILSTKNSTNDYGKIVRKKTIVIFAEKGSPFYKHILSYVWPIMYTKAWTQNIGVKLCNVEKEKLKKYGLEESPALLVFWDTKVIKVIHWQSNIEKVVKSSNVDINELINNL